MPLQMQPTVDVVKAEIIEVGIIAPDVGRGGVAAARAACAGASAKLLKPKVMSHRRKSLYAAWQSELQRTLVDMIAGMALRIRSEMGGPRFMPVVALFTQV